MSHNKGPFWKSNMESMVPRSMSSCNVDYSLKNSVIFCWYFKCGMFARKIVTNIAIRDGIFHHTYHDWPSCKSNVEAMVTNNMRYSLQYASIWMMIFINGLLLKLDLTTGNMTENWFFLVDFTSRSHEYPSAINMIVISTSYSDSFTPKASHYTPEPLKYLMDRSKDMKQSKLIHFWRRPFWKNPIQPPPRLDSSGTPSKIDHYDPL